MSQMVEGGRSIARFRAFGFPVTVDVSFLIIVGILGWYPGVPLRNVVIWVVLATVAVLVHELGHAFVARTTGAEPVITLAGLGGLTSTCLQGRSPAPVGRDLGGRSGGGHRHRRCPAAGRGHDGHPVGPVGDGPGAGIFTTLGWSLLNLLPILPLDGGQTLREPARQPGQARGARRDGVDRGVRARRDRRLPGRLRLRDADGALPRRQQRADDQAGARGRRAGRQPARLRAALGRPGRRGPRAGQRERPRPQQRRADVHDRARGSDDGAGAEARRRVGEAAQDPRDVTGSTVAILVARARGDWPALRDTVAQAPLVGTTAVVAAQNAAHREGEHRAVAEIGQAFLDRTLPVHSEHPGPRPSSPTTPPAAGRPSATSTAATLRSGGRSRAVSRTSRPSTATVRSPRCARCPVTTTSAARCASGPWPARGRTPPKPRRLLPDGFCPTPPDRGSHVEGEGRMGREVRSSGPYVAKGRSSAVPEHRQDPLPGRARRRPGAEVAGAAPIQGGVRRGGGLLDPGVPQVPVRELRRMAPHQPAPRRVDRAERRVDLVEIVRLHRSRSTLDRAEWVRDGRLAGGAASTRNRRPSGLRHDGGSLQWRTRRSGSGGFVAAHERAADEARRTHGLLRSRSPD